MMPYLVFLWIQHQFSSLSHVLRTLDGSPRGGDDASAVVAYFTKAPKTQVKMRLISAAPPVAWTLICHHHNQRGIEAVTPAVVPWALAAFDFKAAATIRIPPVPGRKKKRVLED